MNSPDASPDATVDPVDQLIELSRKPGCAPDDLKAAYLRFAKQLHPDHGGNAKQFQRLEKEYRAALVRLKHGYNFSTGSKRFVPWPVEPTALSHKQIAGGLCVLVILALIGFKVHPAAAIPLASGLGAVAILVLLPMIMASSKSQVVALTLIVVIPISLAFLVGAFQGKRFSEGDGDFRDTAIASLMLPAAATLLASIVGLLFWLAGDRN